VSRHLQGAAIVALLAAGAPGGAQPASDAALRARVERVLRSTPLVDGHNDLPWAIRESEIAPRDIERYDLRKTTTGQTDFKRIKAGLLGGQFWSVYIPGEMRDSGYARVQLEQIDIARRVFAKYPDVFQPSNSAADVRRAFANRKIGSLLGMEGGHAIENSLGALRAFYALGVRYMTLTHNVTLDWADAANDKAVHGGLTPFGKEVVREMNRLGMLVDLSHVSPAVMSDALNTTAAPVIFSHSSARALTDVPRNVPDSILRRLPANGGVVMVTFVPGFTNQTVANHEAAMNRLRDSLTKAFPSDPDARFKGLAAWTQAHPAPRSTVGDVADHIEHIRKTASINNVGIGGDFDGITAVPIGLEDVSKYPTLFVELARRGWSDADLRKLAGENVLRVLTQAEQVAARVQRERPASTATIEQLDGKRPAGRATP
jgi:membrane dipeptidase